MQELSQAENQDIDLLVFHKIGKSKNGEDGQPYEIYDDRIAQYIIENVPLFIMNKKPYIYKNGVYIYDEDGDILKAHIKSLIISEVVIIGRINRVYQLLLSDYRIKKELSQINDYPYYWINFTNSMYDAKEDIFLEHNPKYYSINQIPHEYNNLISQKDIDNSISNKFLCGVIPDLDDRTTLMEFTGYCMTKDTSQQKFLVLTGPGGTGKSSLIRTIEHAIGERNTSNISLQELNQKFYPTNLLGKLLNSCADISKKAIEQTDVIKKITGEDNIQGEYNGGAVFFFKSYAKLLFSANKIPISLDDKSNAFYRRFLIIKIDKRSEYIEDLEIKLKEEIQIVIYQAVQALRNMYARGCIFESKNSVANVMELYKDSDSVMGFIDEHIEIGADFRENRADVFKAYEVFCTENGISALSNRGFYKNLKTKGYNEIKSTGVRYITGLRLRSSEFISVKECNTPFN